MMSTSATPQTSDPMAASAAHEPVTGHTPNAWAAGRGDEFQSETFRALAWSQEDDSLAEPLPFMGDEYSAPEAAPSAPRYRRAPLLLGLAAGFAATAIGGLVLTLVNTDSVPTTTAPVVLQPVQNASIPQSNGDAGNQGGVFRPAAAAPAKTAGSPARTVLPAANTPPIAVSTPAPAVAAATQAAPPPAPEVKTPEVTVPEVATPEVSPPVLVPPPVFSPPMVSPPVLVPPPVVSPPVISLPEVTPQPVPHPVGPPTFHVPVAPEGPMTLPLPHVGVPAPAAPIAPAAPAAPAASNPVITLKPGVTLPQILPTFSGGAGN
jgi:hypothetical protein